MNSMIHSPAWCATAIPRDTTFGLQFVEPKGPEDGVYGKATAAARDWCDWNRCTEPVCFSFERMRGADTCLEAQKEKRKTNERPRDRDMKLEKSFRYHDLRLTTTGAQLTGVRVGQQSIKRLEKVRLIPLPASPVMEQQAGNPSNKGRVHWRKYLEECYWLVTPWCWAAMRCSISAPAPTTLLAKSMYNIHTWVPG